ncbi:Unconventional myosin-X [Cichlidogyrus casuarinus]|uniref:Unconventional myosin-X n=1 Tax=Cichlidogyrus casuarinus TaxID=1844966 RepID=A0ABD2PSX8_9PLAT
MFTSEHAPCAALSLLLLKPEALLYEFKYKKQPKSVQKSEDIVKALYEIEKTSSLRHAAKEESSEEIDLNIELMEDYEIKLEESIEKPVEVHAECDIAKDQYAKSLIDTMRGRHALVSDLMELQSFLSSFAEMISESFDFGSPMANTLCQDLMNNAPDKVAKVSSKEVARMLDMVRKALDWLTNSSNSRLMMVRCLPGYFDRLLSKIEEQKAQIDRTSWKISQAEADINALEMQQEMVARELEELRSEYKILISFLEKELKITMKQGVKVMGNI